MENLKTQNKRLLTNNSPEADLFKPSEMRLQNYEDFFPQKKEINILSEYYNKKKGNNEFVEKIGKLNKKFYNCSENYIKEKKKLENLNDDLYMNLFKQINCYVEEIERLNKKIALNNNQDLKKTIETLNKEIKDKKEKIRNYELKLKEKNDNEEKLMKEIEYYKKRIIFYKDKIKIGLLSRTRNSDFKNKDNAYYLNNRKNSTKNNNYLFPSSDKKIKVYFDKNNINKEESSSKNINNIKEKEKEKIISENDEKDYYKTEAKKNKLRESLFKTEDNHYPARTKNFSDIYDIDNDNDIIEKKEEAYSDNEGLLNLNINLESDSQNFSSKLSNKQSKELFIIQDNDSKNKTFDENNKGKNENQLVKNNENNKTYKKSEIKSKILKIEKNEEDSGNKIIKINIQTSTNEEKSRIFDKTTKSRPSNKNNYIISKFSESKTPSTSTNNKNSKKYVLNKIRPESIKANKNRKININNNRLTTHQNQNQFSNKKLNLTNNNDSEILKGGNKLQQIIRNKNINRRKFPDNNNKDNKDLNNVLKIVNDDYLNSIEMLNVQEEQIKTMLKLMDLNEK